MLRTYNHGATHHVVTFFACLALCLACCSWATANPFDGMLRKIQKAKQKVTEASQKANDALSKVDSTITTVDSTVGTVRSFIPGGSGEEESSSPAPPQSSTGAARNPSRHTPKNQKHSPDGAVLTSAKHSLVEPAAAPPAGEHTDSWAAGPGGSADGSGWEEEPGTAAADSEDWGDGTAVVAVRPVITIKNQGAIQGQTIRLACRITAPDGRPLKGVDAEFVVHDATNAWHSVGLVKTDANGVARVPYVTDAHFPAHRLSSKVDLQVRVQESNQVIQGIMHGVILVQQGAAGN